MDDLASMITQFLNSEEGINQLRAVSSALGIPDPTAAQQPNSGQNNAQQQGFNQVNTAPGAFSSSGGTPQLDLNTLMMLQRAASLFGQEDKNTELLRALKPHFSPERARKVDDVIHIMQLIRLLPLAKELGIFDRLKGGAK